MRERLEAFLGVRVNGELPTTQHAAVLLHDRTAIENLLIERSPFFMVEKAATVGNNTVFGVAHISVDQCAGHFPGRPVVPLIRMCEVAAQVGVVLVGLNGTKEQAPIAVGSGESRALTKSFIEPPVSLLVVAKKVKEKFGQLFVLDATIHVDGAAIAELREIRYLLMQRQAIVR